MEIIISKMKELYFKSKCAYQRAIRGYDDTLSWGLDGYLMEHIVPGIKDFCEWYLKQPEALLNEKRAEIFIKTIELIKSAEDDETLDSEKEQELFKFVGENIAWYWS